MSFRICWIGQAGYLLDNGSAILAIDPFCGEAGQNMKRLYEPEAWLKNFPVDMVACTHHHWDHFDAFTYEQYVIPKILIGPSPCIKLLKANSVLGGIRGVTLNCGDTYQRARYRLTGVLAEHDNDTIGILVESNGYKLYFSGDTSFSSNLLMRNFGISPDLMSVCINGKYGNMHFVEAALYCEFLKARAAVPNHHDMILNNTEDPQQFIDALSVYSPNTRGLILERGVWYPVEELVSPHLHSEQTHP